MPQRQEATSNSVKAQNIFGQPVTIFGVPVERDIIFSDPKGNYKDRIEKQQRKLLVKTMFIKSFLQQDERILCLTTGYSPISILEQILTGPAFLLFKRAMFIFTDKRILHIPMRFHQSGRCAISQISYDDCSGIYLKGRSLEVSYKNNKQECFHYLGRKEKKKIGALLENIAPKFKEDGSLRQRVCLCPSCTNILDTRKFSCPTCKMAFKSSWRARLAALFIPGGGYLYNYYTLPGVVVGLLDTSLLICLGYCLATLKPGTPASFNVIAWLLGLFIAEKFVTTYHAKHLIEDFIPVKKNFGGRKARGAARHL